MNVEDLYYYTDDWLRNQYNDKKDTTIPKKILARILALMPKKTNDEITRQPIKEVFCFIEILSCIAPYTNDALRPTVTSSTKLQCTEIANKIIQQLSIWLKPYITTTHCAITNKLTSIITLPFATTNKQILIIAKALNYIEKNLL